MISEGGWPVFDPGSGGIADLYPYEVEIDMPVEVEVEFLAAEETTEGMPSAWLVERCTTSAKLRSK